MEDRIRITHIITKLGSDGSEMMLYKLVTAMDSRRFENEIISMASLGETGRRLQARGFKVRSLGMFKSFPSPIALFRLIRWLRQWRPALIQTWLYHANLFGGIAARCAGRPPVAWGVHHDNLDPKMNKRRTLWIAKACARLSKILPARIVYCSFASQTLHSAQGYHEGESQVIPNGFDLEEFKPDPEARLLLRRELGLPPDSLLIGLASRYHPLKDIPTFLDAAARLVARFPEVHFVLCGPDFSPENEELLSSLGVSNLRRCCHLLGVRSDMPRLFAAFDIATKPSLS